MVRPTCTASPWSATTSNSIPASAPAASTARAYRSASASRRCGWNALRWEEPADERGNHTRTVAGAALDGAAGPAGVDRRDRFSRQGRLRRAVLRAVGVDGADLADRR